ncbi:MAG: archaeosortase/exosortase family protein [Coriobacteriia bacterium]|nr:archaeosortase/exosortase family protein [Coriobacteriia bacterium]
MTLSVAQLVLAALGWAIATLMLWRSRRWLLFYLNGAFGFILLALFAASVLGYDAWLEAIEARQTVSLATGLGITLDVLGDTGLAIRNHTGWAVFDIGIECSALLEMAAIVGLAIFYPAFSNGRKALTAGIGLGVTYVMNLLRILLIVFIIDAFGTSWVFPAHAVFGRLFFFAVTVALYWYLMTRPTLGVVKSRVEETSDE